MLDVLFLILPILPPIFAGAAVVRAGVLSRSDAHVLSLFFLYLAVPSLLVHQLARQDLSALFDLRYIIAFLVLSLGLYIGAFLVEKLLLKRSVAVSALAAFSGSKLGS